MKKINSFISESRMLDVSMVFGMLFHSRDTAHIIHLGTKSMAIHKALNDYYDDILDLIDDLIEEYQGEFGIVSFKIPGSHYQDPLEYFTKFLEDFKLSKNLFRSDNLKSIMSEIEGELQSLIYKLTNLK